MHLKQTKQNINKQLITLRIDHTTYEVGFFSIEEVSDSPSWTS